MHESDEMFTRLITRFGVKALEKKKEKDFMKHIAAKAEQKPAIIAETQKAKDVPDLSKLSGAEILALKRDASKMPESYQPNFVESFWYKYWEEKKYFHVSAEEALKNDKRYVMVLPPPNVTGYLHLGHGLTSAIEDSLTRIHRQRGYATCYLPGTDHAGIATQTVVEKALAKQQLNKWEMGREKFLEKVWEWKDKHGAQILEQLRRVGSSLDWERYHFTMDEQLKTAVTEAFVLLYEKGLIYRATRLVNWSCQLKTAISDIEVTYEDIKEPIKLKVPGHAQPVEFGWLTHFAYKVKDSNEELVVATTRLETMLGDTAVAVNSKDQRYAHLIGKELVHPFCNRVIKVIADDQLVDMSFGTGAVKVTPAHDPNDYECGQRQKLEFIQIFDEDGKINQNGGKYAGMMRFDCRRQMEEDMKQLGIYRDKTPNQMRLGLCSRSKDVIEPMIKPQWYVNCQHIKQRMIDVVKNGELVLIPSEYENEWFRWMDGLRDWCISRQIWWGHRCPAYLVSINGSQPDTSNQDNWIVARSEEEALKKAVAKYNIPVEQIKLSQDEDVLDTWFSSGLFPFSTFGWPDTNNPDFKAFFPNTILETGWDILFFWVAKMVQFSLEFFDKVPFKYVFLHPLIRDKDGKKMSKSLGNVIDPLEIIDGTSLENLKQKIYEGNLSKDEIQRAIKQKEEEFPNGIPECGGDALRFGLLSYLQKTPNINMDVKHIIGYRQFCNKIWNSCRFAFPKLPKDINYVKLELNNLQLINQWILVKLNQTITGVNAAFDDYEFGQATQNFHQFWLYDFCDIYLEGIKNILSDKNQDQKIKLETQQTLLTVLDQGLRLLHPMMPYLSEELWQKLPCQKEDSLIIAKYPSPNPQWINQDVEIQFDLVLNISKKLRSVISKSQLPANVRPDAYVLNLIGEKSLDDLIKQQADIICLLARIKSITVIQQETEQHKQCGVDTLEAKLKIFVNMKDNIDLTKENERLVKKLNELIKYINALQDKMSKYNDKVPDQVKKTDMEKMEKYHQEKLLTEQQIESLKK
ncbi:unnamed protein product [Paramecium pentaurelia]|uniref:valine--tRNA ligase n=1 Tax=Paramecium pentaurelia TaxID=43138 RepID=A0A8S1YC43_9CILI|nr:unnamed protein product [Paramecium pentaurelia]